MSTGRTNGAASRSRVVLAGLGALVAACTVAACAGVSGTPTRPADAGGPSTVETGAEADIGTGGSTGGAPDPTTSTDPDAPTTDATTTDAGPPQFDAQTTAWFATLCATAGEAAGLGVPVYPHVTDGGQPPPVAQIRSNALADYALLHERMAAEVDALADMPAPTFDGGDELAGNVVKSMRAMAAVAADAPAALSAARTQAELEKAMDSLSDRMDRAEDIVPDDSPMSDDATLDAMMQIPECHGMVGG